MTNLGRMMSIACTVIASCLLWIGSGHVVAQSKPTRLPPGDMQLLNGYRHEALSSIDTYMGRIWKESGPELIYDIGSLAMNEVRLHRERIGGPWQTIVKDERGRVSMEAIMTDDETLHLAFPGATAHFTARRLKSKSDVAEILLMVMSYDQGKGIMEAGR